MAPSPPPTLAPPISHPVTPEHQGAIRCACPPGHQRLRKIMLGIAGVLLLGICALLGYIAWSGSH